MPQVNLRQQRSQIFDELPTGTAHDFYNFFLGDIVQTVGTFILFLIEPQKFPEKDAGFRFRLA